MADVLERVRASLAGRCTIERELGRGGMATVYLARDLKHERSVALKVLHPELAATLGPERFQREIKLAARLQHPHILTVLDSGEAAGQLWYTMPFVEGESLRERLTRERQLPLEDALQITREVADALGYAHGQGVIHRDIKPENILLSRGHALVADFGVARALQTAGGEKLTETGMAVGTPAYMSPEQASAGPDVDARSDLYSLGCVLYEMLAGETPYTGPSAQAVIAKRFSEPIPRVRTVRGGVPEAIDHALSKALAKAPADRFASAAQFAEALGRAMEVRTGRVALGQFLRQRPLFAVLVVGFLVGVGVLFGWRRTRGGAEGAGPKRLAVLPFENLGRADDEYFADGMTEELTARLAGLHGLGVIGRTSAVQYKKTTKTIPQIGQELGVEYILEGTVRWEKPPHGPNRVRVTPQLIRVSDASHVWANVYDAVLADVFAVQSTIARQVAETLNVALVAPEQEALAAKPTTNLEAYDYYLRGNDYEARSYVAEDARLAVQMYQRAVQLDSTFAVAWAALADAHVWRYWEGQTGELPKAQAALERAQQLAPERPETRLALGYYYYHGSRDYDHALEQFAWVRERRPNDPDVFSAIGYIRRRQGRWAEAVSDLTRATELDPRNHAQFYELGVTYGLLLRRYSEAERALGRAISLAPDVPGYHTARAYIYLMQDGNAARAKQELRQAASTLDPARILVEGFVCCVLVRLFAADYGEALTRLTLQAAGGDSAGYYLAKAEFYGVRNDMPAAHACYDSARVVLEAQRIARPAHTASEQPVQMPLALAYAGLGRKADAIRLGREGAQLVPVSRDALAGPTVLLDLVEIYVRTGEYDAALDRVEYLLSIPSSVSIALLRIDPLYAPLRGNPRFERLVQGKR